MARRHGVVRASQCLPPSRHVVDATRQLVGLGRAAPLQMAFRADFPSAAIEGKVAVEFIGRAAEAISGLARPYATDCMESCGAATESRPMRLRKR